MILLKMLRINGMEGNLLVQRRYWGLIHRGGVVMRLFYIFLLFSILSSCDAYFHYAHHLDFPPLKWQGENKFSNEMVIKRVNSGWDFKIDPATHEDYQNLLKLTDCNTKGTLINTGNDIIWFSWYADCEDEKQVGEIAVIWENGAEKRTLLLKPGERVLWHVDKFEKLLGGDFFRIGSGDLGGAKKLKFVLQIEFDDPEKLKSLVDVSKLEIRLSANTTL